MSEFLFSNESLSATRLANLFKSYDISKEQIVAYLKDLGFVENIRTITAEGLKHGISYMHGDNDAKWPVYGYEIQQLVYENIETISKYPKPEKQKKVSNTTVKKSQSNETRNGIVLNPATHMTELARINGVSSEKIKRASINIGFIEYNNSKPHVTAFGSMSGVVEKFNIHGGSYVVYPVEAQKKILTELGFSEDAIQIKDNPRPQQTSRSKKNFHSGIGIKIKPFSCFDDALKKIAETEFTGALPNDYTDFSLEEFLVLDTETTGGRMKDEVIELALLDMRGTVVYESTFYPQTEVDKYCQTINHLNKAMLEGSPLFADEWPKIKKLIGKTKLYGHNLAFDRRLIAQTLTRYGMNPEEANEVFANYYESMSICRWAIPDCPSYALASLAKLLKIERNELHRAADDCLMTIEVLSRIKEICTEQGEQK